jgi:hypothetical protein
MLTERFLVMYAYVDHDGETAVQGHFVITGQSLKAAIENAERALSNREWVIDLLFGTEDIWKDGAASGYSIVDDGEFEFCVLPLGDLIRERSLQLPATDESQSRPPALGHRQRAEADVGSASAELKNHV